MNEGRTHIIPAGAFLLEIIALYRRLTGGFFVGHDYCYPVYLRMEPPVNSLYRPLYIDYFSGMWFRPLVMTRYFISWVISGFHTPSWSKCSEK